MFENGRDFDVRLKAKLRRHIVERCLYGVDIDPLAIELGRISLWIETMDRELPFGFLDHKLKPGNSLVIMEIHARLRQLRSRGQVGLVVVDYLQLLRDGGRHNTRAEAVGATARALKLMAGEFECPVLLLSQFNRDSAKSKPTYGHLFPGRGKEATERYEKAMEKARENSEADVKTLA